MCIIFLYFLCISNVLDENIILISAQMESSLT